MAALSLTACGKKENTDSQTGTKTDNQTQSGSTNSGSSSSDSNKSDSKASNEVQVVTVWSDAAHSQSIRDAQVEEFNNTIGKEEGIRIEYTIYGSDYADTINVALMANDGPDLFSPSSNTFAQYVAAGYAVPISDLEGSEALLAKYDKANLLVGDQIFNDKV